MDDQTIFKKYLLLSYRFLGFRSRSEKEIRDHLKEKKAPEEMIERVLTRLKEQRFVNDTAFAQQWVESRSRVKPRSQFILRMELKQKGIAEDIIESVLQKAEGEGQSDSMQAKTLAEKHIKKYRGLGKREMYQKLGGVLARKGFSWTVSKKAIDEVLGTDR